MKRNIFLTLGVSIISIATLSGCNSGTKELKIWAWNKNVDALKAGIETYKKEVDPNFKATVESFARMDIDKKFKTASQSNNLNAIGDVVLCDGQALLSYYDLWSNIFTDISSYVTNEELGNLVQSTLQTVQVEGKLLGLPLDVAPTVVFANKNLWDAEILNKVKNEGWTWEDYYSIGKQIKASKGNDVTMTSYSMRWDDRIYRAMVSQKGEWLMDKDYNVFVGNENSIQAMASIKRMFDENIVGHIDTGDYKSLMKNNKVAAQIQGFFLGGQLKDIAPEMAGDWVVLPLPKWNTNDALSASITGGSYLYANSKLQGKSKDDAVNFIKWMTLHNETSMQSLKVGGVYPALKSSYQLDYFKNTKDPYFVNDAVWNEVASWSKDAKAILATKYNSYNLDAFCKTQETILFSEVEINITEELLKLKKDLENHAK